MSRKEFAGPAETSSKKSRNADFLVAGIISSSIAGALCSEREHLLSCKIVVKIMRLNKVCLKLKIKIIALILPTVANMADDSSNSGRGKKKKSTSPTQIFLICPSVVVPQQCIFDRFCLNNVAVAVKGMFRM